MGYRLEGDLLEVCDCKVLCPCWIVEKMLSCRVVTRPPGPR